MGRQSSINDVIRRKLKQLRLAGGLTLRAAARRAGIPVSSYSQMESGYYRVHTDFLFRMLGALEADISEVWPVENAGAGLVDEALYALRIQSFRLTEVCDWCGAEGACLFCLADKKCSILLRQGLSNFLVDRVRYCLEDGRKYPEGVLLEKRYQNRRFVLFLKTEACDDFSARLAEKYLTKWAVLFSDQDLLESARRNTINPRPQRYLRSERAQESLALKRNR